MSHNTCPLTFILSHKLPNVFIKCVHIMGDSCNSYLLKDDRNPLLKYLLVKNVMHFWPVHKCLQQLLSLDIYTVAMNALNNYKSKCLRNWMICINYITFVHVVVMKGCRTKKKKEERIREGVELCYDHQNLNILIW